MPELSEGDVVTIFSQFGEPVFINLVRDKETGKSKGFAFLKYEDQRSTDLAVDNLGGATIMERMLRVDHTNYKRKDDESLTDNTINVIPEVSKDNENSTSRRRRRESDDHADAPLKEELELQQLINNHDDLDPMKSYLIEQKKEDIEAARQRLKSTKRSTRDPHRKHRHHHRSRRNS